MEKKVSESQQRIKHMMTKPIEASDKSFATVCKDPSFRSCVVNEATNECELLNFQTAVSVSYQTIEDDINKLYPNLKRTSKQDLRTYVKFLQSKFSKLTDTICENYVCQAGLSIP